MERESPGNSERSDKRKLAHLKTALDRVSALAAKISVTQQLHRQLKCQGHLLEYYVTSKKKRMSVHEIPVGD
ncbi:hypothetical protein SK128_000275 [Halocaridina rubra]|uniref:Uncharacterized protein n=1 Tax=Halocaridina rubra TaxID=373956 RepID=A0AAN8XEB6_HALRR